MIEARAEAITRDMVGDSYLTPIAYATGNTHSLLLDGTWADPLLLHAVVGQEEDDITDKKKSTP
jgi:hypothetical protein